MTEHVYQVIVTRENGAWLADVPELEGAHTWARNFPALDRAVREVIVLAADLPDEAASDVRVSYDIRTGQPDLDEQTRRLRKARAALDRAAAELWQETTQVAQRLSGEGWSVRDIAALLGVSPQRVSQLAARSDRYRASRS